jgi:hypothetical protein
LERWLPAQGGGTAADITVAAGAAKGTVLFAGVCAEQKGHDPSLLAGWELTALSLWYSAGGATRLQVYRRAVPAGGSRSVVNDPTFCGTTLFFAAGGATVQ